ncbi:TPA: hypothetical protein U0679_000306 [Streptococcus suis]|uniref:hypothetical protein n=1 Tax=Streptococcus suis TaxID=1307 RepID=UPI0004199E4A|nr:hypothetical protein [Streptococcus suis]NQK39571.1 hypothetical protein [Streptococcus suis]HEM2900495.1 hypothetical protein [Streptococcus suis]HEM3204472.1 hypothetical protein [Streptococcus suis 93A]HEM3214766.1 hypothetical protein [Streptococcus suis]HEM4076398.1 hypothetical protein [Streptococcus suis]
MEVTRHTNKRIKKKRELIEQVQGTKEAVDIALNIIKSLLDENAKQANEIAELRSIIERNAQATNSRFDKIEKQVANSNAKKPFWKR